MEIGQDFRQGTNGERNRADRVLTWALILGGVAPMLSGLLATGAADTYVQFIGAGVPGMFTADTYPVLLSWITLQGGDAFVAGASRVIVALVGTLAVKRLFAVVGIAHSLFELWLLPTQILSWCSATDACRPLFTIEVWGFMLLHVLLVAGFSYGLIAGYRGDSNRGVFP